MVHFSTPESPRPYSNDELRQALSFTVPGASKARYHQLRRTPTVRRLKPSTSSVTLVLPSASPSPSPPSSPTNAGKPGRKSKTSDSPSPSLPSQPSPSVSPPAISLSPPPSPTNAQSGPAPGPGGLKKPGGGLSRSLKHSVSVSDLLGPSAPNSYARLQRTGGVWVPLIMRSHPERKRDGCEFPEVSDVSRILRVPPRKQDLWPKQLLTMHPMDDDVRRAIETNMECREALLEAVYHKYYVAHSIPQIVKALQENLIKPPKVERKPTGRNCLQPLDRQVDIQKLLIESRDNLQVRDFVDEQYTKFINDYDKSINRWQSMVDD